MAVRRRREVQAGPGHGEGQRPLPAARLRHRRPPAPATLIYADGPVGTPHHLVKHTGVQLRLTRLDLSPSPDEVLFQLKAVRLMPEPGPPPLQAAPLNAIVELTNPCDRSRYWYCNTPVLSWGKGAATTRNATGAARHECASARPAAEAPAVELASPDESVRELETVATRHGADFEGWGPSCCSSSDSGTPSPRRGLAGQALLPAEGYRPDTVAWPLTSDSRVGGLALDAVTLANSA